MNFITSNYLTLMVASNRSLVNRYSEIQSLKQFRKTHNITRTDNVSGIDDNTEGGRAMCRPRNRGEARGGAGGGSLLPAAPSTCCCCSAFGRGLRNLRPGQQWRHTRPEPLPALLSLYQLFLSQLQHDESSAPRRPGPRRRQSVDRCWAIEWDVRTVARECGDDGTLEKILF